MSIHSGSRQILIHGMVLVMVGLLWALRFRALHTRGSRLAPT
jgi:hypothetical protein